MILKWSNKSIFITHNQYNKLPSLVGFEFKRAASINEWSKKSNKEVNELLVKAIKKLNLSEAEFLEQFVNINLKGVEAKENTYALISNFIKDSGLNFRLEEGNTKFTFEKLMYKNCTDEYGDYFPKGKYFYLTHFSHIKESNCRKLINYFKRKNSKQFDRVKLIINTENILKIVGCFGYAFRIYFDNNQIMEFRWRGGSDDLGPGVKQVDSSQDLRNLKLNFKEFSSGDYFSRYR